MLELDDECIFIVLFMCAWKFSIIKGTFQRGQAAKSMCLSLFRWEEINYVLNCIPERYIFPFSLAGLGQVGKETIMFFLSVPFINHHSGSKQFCSFFMSQGSQYRFSFFQLESIWKLSLMLGFNQLLFNNWASNHFTATKMESWPILSVTLEFIYSFCCPKLSCWRPTQAAWVK